MAEERRGLVACAIRVGGGGGGERALTVVVLVVVEHIHFILVFLLPHPLALGGSGGLLGLVHREKAFVSGSDPGVGLTASPGRSVGRLWGRVSVCTTPGYNARCRAVCGLTWSSRTIAASMLTAYGMYTVTKFSHTFQLGSGRLKWPHRNRYPK